MGMPNGIPVCLRIFHRANLLANLYSLFEFEAQRRLGGQNDFFVSGECRSGRACARAGCRADGCAFAAAGQRADQRSSACAAADEPGRPFAFAFD